MIIKLCTLLLIIVFKIVYIFVGVYGYCVWCNDYVYIIVLVGVWCVSWLVG